MSHTRRLAAILSADVAGYSRLMGEDEIGTARALGEHRAAADPLVARHGGRIVKTTGDGMLIEFSSVVGAVECSLALQELAAERNAGIVSDRRMEWRIGIHIGDVLVEGDDILGDGVNIAARLEGIAEPGGIYISEDAFRQVRGKVGTEFADIGEQSLKNIARPLRVYRAGPSSAAKTPSPPVTALSLPDKPSLALLPFQNMTGDPEQEYFVDGMVEEITTAISRLPWLFVIARNSSFTYKGKAVDVKQVARELGVRYLLEGSVRKAGNRVRITGQLVDTTTGAHIWADRFDGALDDIFELQDLVASNVAGAIEPKLRQSEIERATRKPTESLDAWDLYLRALALRYQYTEESIREAIVMLRRALAIDPSFAPAAAMIGSCLMHQRVHRLAAVADAEIAEAVRLAKGAIDTGKDDPDALWTAGWTVSVFGRDPAMGANVIDRALTLNPNSAHAWMARGLVSIFQNRPDGAIEAAERAIRLSPLDPWGARAFTYLMALAHFAAGRYEQAIEWADRSLAAQPGYRTGLMVKIVASAQLGRVDEARDALSRVLELESDLTIAQWKAPPAPPFPPELLARYEDGLRKAGLPEE
jgi:adenylate cyclase